MEEKKEEKEESRKKVGREQEESRKRIRDEKEKQKGKEAALAGGWRHWHCRQRPTDRMMAHAARLCKCTKKREERRGEKAGVKRRIWAGEEDD
jgi:hypothetical protein